MTTLALSGMVVVRPIGTTEASSARYMVASRSLWRIRLPATKLSETGNLVLCPYGAAVGQAVLMYRRTAFL